MAKVYLREGIRRGRVGNETYYYQKGVNIVRMAIISKHDALTDPQLFARGRYCNTVKMYKLLKESLIGCFEKTKESDNDKNKFYSLNLGQCCPISRDFFREAKYPSIGEFITSQGSLGRLDIGTTTEYPYLEEEEEIKKKEIKKKGKKEPNPTPIPIRTHGVIIPRTNISSADPTIGRVSTNLIERYPWIHEGDTFRMFGYLYAGLRENTGADKYENPILEVEESTFKHIYVYNREFTINKNNTENLSTKGFIIVDYATVGTETTAVIAIREESGYAFNNISMVNIVGFQVDIGGFGAVILRNTATLNLCSSGVFVPNSCLSLINNLVKENKYKETTLSLWKDYYKKRGKKIK